jgi:hypothetical protein
MFTIVFVIVECEVFVIVFVIVRRGTEFVPIIFMIVQGEMIAVVFVVIENHAMPAVPFALMIVPRRRSRHGIHQRPDQSQQQSRKQLVHNAPQQEKSDPRRPSRATPKGRAEKMSLCSADNSKLGHPWGKSNWDFESFVESSEPRFACGGPVEKPPFPRPYFSSWPD